MAFGRKFLAAVGLALEAELELLRLQRESAEGRVVDLADAYSNAESAWLAERAEIVANLDVAVRAVETSIDVGHSIENHNGYLTKQLDLAVAQYEQVYAENERLTRAVRDLQDVLDRRAETVQDLLQQIDEANTFIAQLQRERPQLRLVKASAAGEPGDGAAGSKKAELTNIVSRQAWRVASVHFESHRAHWIVARGTDDTLQQIKVAVHDKEFLSRVREGHERFRAGTVVIADFRTITYDDESFEMSVELVHEVVHPKGKQTELSFDPPGASSPADEGESHA